MFVNKRWSAGGLSPLGSKMLNEMGDEHKGIATMNSFLSPSAELEGAVFPGL